MEGEAFELLLGVLQLLGPLDHPLLESPLSACSSSASMLRSTITASISSAANDDAEHFSVNTFRASLDMVR